MAGWWTWCSAETIEATSGRVLADAIPRTRYSSVAWRPDGSGFFYTRYPDPAAMPPGEAEYNSHAFFHRLGFVDVHLVYRPTARNRSGAAAALCVGKGDHDISLDARRQLVAYHRCVIRATGSRAPRAADLVDLVVEAR